MSTDESEPQALNVEQLSWRYTMLAVAEQDWPTAQRELALMRNAGSLGALTLGKWINDLKIESPAIDLLPYTVEVGLVQLATIRRYGASLGRAASWNDIDATGLAEDSVLPVLRNTLTERLNDRTVLRVDSPTRQQMRSYRRSIAKARIKLARTQRQAKPALSTDLSLDY